MLTRDGVKSVRSIEEDLQEVGLKPTAVVGEIERMTQGLAEAKKNGGNAGPPVSGTAPPRSVENRALQESRTGGAPAGKPGRKSSEKPVSETAPRDAKGKRVTLAEGARQALRDAGKDPAANQDEAFKVIKKIRKTAAMKLASRLYRKAHKSAMRVASRVYRRRNKRKIAVRMKRKLKKFGRGLLQKLHKAGRRIVMSDDSALANLREDLNSNGGVASGDSQNQYEDAAHNAGVVSMLMAEVFEALGDQASADTMQALSDVSSDLADDLGKLGADGTMSESQDERLRKVLAQVVKGLKVYEGMGSPGLFDAIRASRHLADD